MIDEKTAQEILDNIANAGEADEVHINGNMNHVISRSSGLPRIQTNVAKKFQLILAQPKELLSLNALQIRCCVCKRVITYPAWYYKLAYTVNKFYYFICFDQASPEKPNVSCLNRK